MQFNPQFNAFENFQNRAKVQESLRYNGQNSFSQIRSFLEGKPVKRSDLLDIFVWLIGGGYRNIRIGGRVPENLVNRSERPTISLEKFFADFLQYFFNQNFTQNKIEELYLKFTNQMTADDVEIVYKATSGEIDISPDILEQYAGDRRFANGALIFQRSVYDELKAEKVAVVAEAPRRGRPPKKASEDVSTESVSEPQVTSNEGSGDSIVDIPDVKPRRKYTRRQKKAV